MHATTMRSFRNILQWNIYILNAATIQPHADEALIRGSQHTPSASNTNEELRAESRKPDGANELFVVDNDDDNGHDHVWELKPTWLLMEHNATT